MDVKVNFATHKLLVSVREMYGTRGDMKQKPTKLSCGGIYIPEYKRREAQLLREIRRGQAKQHTSYFDPPKLRRKSPGPSS